MIQTWRWFGGHDPVSIADILQSNGEGIVTGLHHIDNGEVWTIEEIQRRQDEISKTADGKPSGLSWAVVESLPVSEEIKKQDGQWLKHIENYKQSLRNLAESGIHTICYNFMPVLDWTRTALRHTLPNGATCMRYDHTDMAVFDIHILKRKGAADSFTAEIVEAAEQRFADMSDDEQQKLIDNIVCGLPGANQVLSLAEVQTLLSEYDDIDEERLRKHQYDFLEAVIPLAESLGMRLCCHPDDPPFSLLGLPRVMSCEEDYKRLVETIDSPANGITLCTGSLGPNPNVDLPNMMRRLGDKVHFVHIRNVKRETAQYPGDFHEAEHLTGDTDVVDFISAVLEEEVKRRANGRSDHRIPMRPDHGHDILDDLTKESQPGYPAIGRMKGLAELRGVITALQHPIAKQEK